jgi:hypothetical protein
MRWEVQLGFLPDQTRADEAESHRHHFFLGPIAMFNRQQPGVYEMAFGLSRTLEIEV